MTNLMQLVKLAPLMDRSLSSLSMDELRAIGSALGIKVAITSELRDAALALLEGQSLDKVSDLIQNPESVKQLVTFVKGGLTSVSDAEVKDHPDYEGVQALTISFY